MGLDMYLEAERYISGYPHAGEASLQQYAEVRKAARLDAFDNPEGSRRAKVNVIVGYWRKANAIHAWFVRECGNDVDDCRSHYVSEEKLAELREVCERALAAFDAGDKDEAAEILPPQSGFFFGSTKVDDWYRQDLVDTIEIIDRTFAAIRADDPTAPNGYVDLYYRASW